MTTLWPVASGSSTGGTTSQSGSGISSVADSYELFLSILTTQIQNQDPLDPMDSSQYTEQLVQYSSVEQQIKANDQLSDVLSYVQAANASSFVSYVGGEVTASGASTSLKSGEASWTFDAPEAGRANIEVRNANGALMYSSVEDVTYGANQFVWDGKSNTGSDSPDGIYTISIRSVDDTGQLGSVIPTTIKGIVTGVDFSGTEPILKVGGGRVAVSDVIEVNLL